MQRVPAAILRHWIERALAGRGVPREHRRLVSDGLVEASLRGIDTHGVRLLPVYLAELDGGRSRPRPRLAWSPRGGAALGLDADAALGVVAGSLAADATAALARDHGVGAVAIGNSNHFGPASCYTLRMARAGTVGFAFSNSDALVAPHGGLRPFLGTDPMSVAACGEEGEVFCLDMATSQISYSKVKARRSRGETLEPGWAIGADGTDAAESAGEISALRPLGGYKGQGLALAIQVLCALLTGMPFDHRLSHLYEEPFDEPRRIGHFLMAVDVAAFEKVATFRRRLSELMRALRSQESAPGARVVAPGDLERESHAERSAGGVPLTREELEQIRRGTPARSSERR